MDDLVHDRLTSLQTRGAAELVSLPASSTEILQMDGKDIKLTVYLDSLGDGRYRVVVQGVQERWAGITAKVIAKGFEVASDGTKRVLEPKELYDFT